jgi:hypothetical protein
MSRDWLTVNFPTHRAISIAPRRAAERLSLCLLTRHEVEHRPLSRQRRTAQGRNDGNSKAEHANVRLQSSYPVEQLLGACLQIKPRMLMGFVAGRETRGRIRYGRRPPSTTKNKKDVAVRSV